MPANALKSQEEAKIRRLRVDDRNPDHSVEALRDVLAAADLLFDRGGPVRLVVDQLQGGTVAQPMTRPALVLITHKDMQALRP